jgi:putative ABC transport system permease protein
VVNCYDPVGTPVPIVLTAGTVPGADDEIVLAPTSERRLGAALGSSLPVTGDRGTHTMRVVGIGYGVQSSTTSYDEGAWITPGGYDRLFTGFKEHGALLTVRSDVSPTRLIPRLQQDAATVKGGGGLLVFPAFLPVQASEIADVRVLPLLLGGFLVLVAVVAVGQTLVLTLRSRTYDIAALRALGMTPRQSRGVVVTQSLVYAATGLLLGVPLGLALGRALWRVTTNIMPLRYQPPVAAWALILVVPVVILVAAALAAAPAWRASHLCLGEALRTE